MNSWVLLSESEQLSQFCPSWCFPSEINDYMRTMILLNIIIFFSISPMEKTHRALVTGQILWRSFEMFYLILSSQNLQELSSTMAAILEIRKFKAETITQPKIHINKGHSWYSNPASQPLESEMLNTASHVCYSTVIDLHPLCLWTIRKCWSDVIQ